MTRRAAGLIKAGSFRTAVLENSEARVLMVGRKTRRAHGVVYYLDCLAPVLSRIVDVDIADGLPISFNLGHRFGKYLEALKGNPRTERLKTGADQSKQ